MAIQYRSEYDPITGKTTQIAYDDGVAVGTYDSNGTVTPYPTAPSVTTPVIDTTQPNDLTDETEQDPNALVGVGPDAALTYAERDAKNAAAGDPYGALVAGTAEDYSGGQIPGETLAEAKARIANRPLISRGATNYVTSGQSESLKKQYGLKGLDVSLSGLTHTQAEAKAKQYQAERLAGTSALTSYSYSPETIAGTKKANDDFQLKLNDITNSPWAGIGSKTDAVNTQLAVTANDLAKNWTAPDAFLKDFTNNPEIQKNLQGFLNAGGTKEQILSNITKNAQPDISTIPQTTADYMANLTAPEQTGMIKAAESLIPEIQSAQDEIARIAGIPKDIQDLYFGTKDKIGIYDKQVIQATEAKRIIEQKEADTKTSLEAKAQLLKDKNNADAIIAVGNIEKNRLAAKNYMTGMLAKLGALNTTSAGADAIVILDEKYQKQTTELQSKLSYNNSVISMNLNNNLNKVTTNADEKINAIEQDLSKSGTDMIKEIMKEKQAAEKAIYGLTTKYQALFRTQVDKYTKEAKAAADKYTKEFAKTVSGGLDLKAIAKSIDTGNAQEGEYIVSGKTKGILLPDGTVKPMTLTSTQANQVTVAKLVDEDTMRYFISLPAAFRSYWQQLVDASRDEGKRYSLKAVQAAYKDFTSKKKATTINSSEINFDTL